RKQQTLKQSITFEGIGLHTGHPIRLELHPAPINIGRILQRIDLDEKPSFKADLQFVSHTQRHTVLSKNEVNIKTVEHLMSALVALQIDNIVIQLNNEELPILDGSAIEYYDAIKEVGIEIQAGTKIVYPISKTIRYKDEISGAELTAIPSDYFNCQLSLAHENDETIVPNASLNTLDDYATELAAARTYCKVEELNLLLEHDLIKGGRIDNAVIYADSKMELAEKDKLAQKFGVDPNELELGPGAINTKLRYANEAARHKLLDIIGDLGLINEDIQATIIAHKPGHTHNIAFAKLIKEHIQKMKKDIPQVDIYQDPIRDINAIEKTLPHRFPFLLVDKILKLDDTEVIGMKMVTRNEPFFQGHFPGAPVMPGVLIMEAMAQAGGILLLETVEDPENYLTYFMKMDNVKFRKSVGPGEVLIFKLNLVSPIRRGICEMQGYAYSADQLVAEGLLTAKISKRDDR
ncbi:UNVERIFIED_CONTAM: hypothetical protein GTU68_063569, partial [Idotea baltica]|nr:hypothetical protein [Idotea baltica]